MAEYTALVEAGNALVELLRDNMTPEPVNSRETISLCSPHESGGNQLTVYLFHIEEDQQNNQAGYYQHSVDIQRINPCLYQLNFLITAHSKAPAQLKEADQYRMLGAALQIIKDHPVLDKKYLTGSLGAQEARVHLTVERPSFDQLLKIWNNTSSNYKLSIVCKASSVAIDSKRQRKVARVGDAVLSLEQKEG